MLDPQPNPLKAITSQLVNSVLNIMTVGNLAYEQDRLVILDISKLCVWCSRLPAAVASSVYCISSTIIVFFFQNEKSQKQETYETQEDAHPGITEIRLTIEPQLL